MMLRSGGVGGARRSGGQLLRLLLVAGMLFLGVTGVSHGEEVDSSLGELFDLGLEQVTEVRVVENVVSASQFSQSEAEAPASVTIVTADEIRKYGYRTLADILRATRSFYVSYDRSYAFLGFRGFSRPGDFNCRLLLLVDGHRINDAIYESATIGTDFILDIGLIERVEIIRGATSSLYGTSAFFGVINVITREGRRLDGTEVSGAAGNLGTYGARLSYGARLDQGADILFSGSMYSSDGQRRIFYPEFDDPATNSGVAENRDTDRSVSFFTKSSFGKFTLTGAYVSREKQVPTGIYDTIFNDPGNKNVDERAYIDLKYDGSFGGTDVVARLFFDQYQYEGYFATDRTIDLGLPRVMNIDDLSALWWGAELQASRRFLKRVVVTAGTSFRSNFRIDLKNYDHDPRESLLDERHRYDVWAVYGQAEVRLMDSLIVNAGARFDSYESIATTTNPRLALIYTPLKGTTFKMLYGGAFRAPNASELFYVGTGYKANPNLKPETNRTTELVYEQRWGSYVHSRVGGYWTRIKSLITQVVDPDDGLYVYRNAGTIDATGIEVEVHGEYPPGVQCAASYSYQDARDADIDQWLTNSPHHLAKASATFPLFRNIVYAGAELQYTGPRRTIADAVAGGFTVANITVLNRNIVPGLEISASVYNIFDKRFADPVTDNMRQDVIRQDGITVLVKATYQF